ncbi:MAG: hypothetical protein VX346_07850 [Planctomycetota bacterium]|nr:hypothetical protein [Planctomycetota bacterium]
MNDHVLLCGHRERPGLRTGSLLSTDFSNAWSQPQMIDFTGGAYPSLVDGRVLGIHYQEGADGSIRQAVFKVSRASRTIELVDP